MIKTPVIRPWPVALLVCSVGLDAPLFVLQPPVAAQERPVHHKFEYRVLYESQLLKLTPKDAPGVEEALNKLGEEGWELVTVTLDIRPEAAVVRGAPPPRENRFYLKRPM